MEKSISLLVLALALATPSTANAQAVPVKWSVLSKPVYLHTAMPAGCDEPLVRAVATWNAQTVKFKYQFDKAANLTTTRWSVSNNANVTIEDGVTSSAAALMSTSRRTTGTTIVDADITVKGEYLWYNSDESGGKFYCSATAGTTPSTKYDYQTAMAHELGHAFGMDHGGATTCIIYASLGAGVARRTPCATEVTAFRGAYGTQ